MVQMRIVALVLAVALRSCHGQQPNGQDQRQGKNLLDWIGLGTGPETDPYMARSNSNCLNGDLAECFKSRALGTFDEFFGKPIYQLSENARIVKMPETQLRQLVHENYEYSESPRSDEPEWDQLVKFALRKVEKFMKSTAFEIDFDNEVTERGRYSPRFVDEIADEIDIIEDKKDTLFKRKQLKKLFIPLLLVLKIFKLKLLLFLPLILGLASFKKFLGFLAIIIPGAIAYFKLCKPDFQSAFGGYGSHGHVVPQYSPAGIGYHQQQHFREQPTFTNHYEQSSYDDYNSHKGLTFRDSPNQAQNLAYSGYYRNSGKDIPAETSSKKSILPDS
ncbi:PREDICTED: uncharacterized protein LOC108566303 [Nicrophorus vespilloides]|uniref:Uncharacterized protein LOC108566303 n=1 Tax=Nicrophorus vespilloides TaxID=110193 RepID=A0ABM1N452_NICVS|nr:PREDICTED: uncharacterized protein LOC108566303 [Nicrophorus vespilloides]